MVNLASQWPENGYPTSDRDDIGENQYHLK